MMHNELGQERKFVPVVLPLLAAAAAFVIYVLTLNHWVSLASLPYAKRAMGLAWTPELTGYYGPGNLGPYSPLIFVITYPLRWLPVAWIPLALNLFSAICAALTLALLARSVALLPHDRTHEQRQREHSPFALLSLRTAWIPPVLAVVVCGLQLSFWENATSASGAIFDLLLFAYIIRCLLEYRISQRDSWLWRAALVYGAATTGDWLMIALFPAFVAALLWIKGLDFFNLRFLRWMFLCGLLGLAFYLVLPLVYKISGDGSIGFWQALKVNVATEKGVVQTFAQKVPKYLLLLLATTSLLPMLLIGIRWSSYFGDPSRIGIAITTGILHLAFAALLVTCIWTAFDPVFSPRHRGIPLLALNFLGALSIGYFAGYFLLVFKPLPDRMGRTLALQGLLHLASQAVVWALLLVVPVGLIWKNAPQIRMTNGPMLKHFVSLMTQNLPDHGVLLGDDATRVGLAQIWIQGHGVPQNYMFLESESLHNPIYIDFQQKHHPNEWPTVPGIKKNQLIPDMVTVNLISKLADNNPLVYLNPSFGYYFEFFYPRAHGLVYQLERYPTNVISAPAFTEAEIRQNETFWQDTQPLIDALPPYIQQPLVNRRLSILQRLKRSLHIPFEPNQTAVTLGRFLSMPLNVWGVEMQRANRLKEAGKHFESALALNPNNMAARINLEFNRDLQAGRPPGIQPFKSFEEEFGKFRNWEQLLQDNGPFDDPTHCFIQGVVFLQGHLSREAVQQFERVHELVPDNLPARFWLARFYATRFPDKSLALIESIHSQPLDVVTNAGVQLSELSVVEATALFAAHRAPDAELLLRKVMEDNTHDERLLAMIVQISASYGRLTNALLAVEQELQISPTNTAALVIQGYLNMQIGNFEQAIPPLTRALLTETNNYAIRYPALLDRAIAYLRMDKLEDAERDYQAVQKINPASFQIYYGLGEIAWRRKDTNGAIYNYELYLTNSPPDAEEAKMVGERLQSLKTGSP